MKRKRIKPGSDSALCAYIRHEASSDEARAFYIKPKPAHGIQLALFWATLCNLSYEWAFYLREIL